MSVVAGVTKEHPTYFNMASDAIKTLKERKGSSRAAILKYIVGKYNLDASYRVYLLRNE